MMLNLLLILGGLNDSRIIIHYIINMKASVEPVSAGVKVTEHIFWKL